LIHSMFVFRTFMAKIMCVEVHACSFRRKQSALNCVEQYAFMIILELVIWCKSVMKVKIQMKEAIRSVPYNQVEL
jgi:hypothetical protein